MTVVFESVQTYQNRISGIKINGKPIVFDGGVYQTTDKDEIEGLLAHPFYRRNRFVMVSDPELVAKYLSSDEEPDYINKDYLGEVSDEAIIAIGKVVGARNEFAPLIKSELQGMPVTSAVAQIVKADLASQDEPEEEPEKPKETTKKKAKETEPEEPTKKKSSKKKSKKKSSSKKKKK